MVEEISEAYIVTKISLRTRLIKSFAFGIATIGLIFLFWPKQLQNGTHLDDFIVPLILLLLGGYLSWKSFQTSELKELSGTWVTYPNKDKRKNVKIALILGTLPIAFLIWTAYETKQNLMGEALFSIVIIGGILSLYIIPQLRPKKEFILSAAAISEKQRIDAVQAKKSAEEREKWALVEEKWWYRYGVATLILVGAWCFYEYKPSLWWVSLIAVLAAMVYARELSIFIIGLIAIWFIGKGFASLSVTGAIIVGACIIAYAISSNK